MVINLYRCKIDSDNIHLIKGAHITLNLNIVWRLEDNYIINNYGNLEVFYK